MSIETFHYDFTERATRKAVFGPLVERLDNREKFKVASVVNDYSIRDKEHLHDIAAVERAIGASIASDWAKAQAKAVYRILANAEAQVHDCPVEQTHFHEVGLGMTCREVLAICTAIELLAPQRITATPIQVGSGTVECAHGLLDIPAPATAAIIEAYGIPVVEDKLDGELCTPTSAALIAHFVDEFVEVAAGARA